MVAPTSTTRSQGCRFTGRMVPRDLGRRHLPSDTLVALSGGDRGNDVGQAETLVGAGGHGGGGPTLAATIDGTGETLIGDATDANSATIRGLGVAGDHPSLLPVDDRAYAIGEEIARGGMGKIL